MEAEEISEARKARIAERVSNVPNSQIKKRWLFDCYKSTMKGMLDYGGFICKEAALQQRGDRGFLTGVRF